MAGIDEVRRLITIDDRSAAAAVVPIGNEWSRACFDGPFFVHRAPADRPAVSLVFVQSRNGNTVAPTPADLGGGPTDKHLLYEGLSRVAADAVLAGATTVGPSTFFTITHPELVALRSGLGLPRHPVQMIISNEGHVDLSARMFNTPDVRAIILGGDGCVRRLAPQLHDRPWVTLLPIGGSLAAAFAQLRSAHGIGRISCVGGRVTATSLVDAGLVQDLYLTTSAIDAGEPGTPWYAGRHNVQLNLIVRKREAVNLRPIVFEHFAVY